MASLIPEPEGEESMLAAAEAEVGAGEDSPLVEVEEAPRSDRDWVYSQLVAAKGMLATMHTDLPKGGFLRFSPQKALMRVLTQVWNLHIDDYRDNLPGVLAAAGAILRKEATRFPAKYQGARNQLEGIADHMKIGARPLGVVDLDSLAAGASNHEPAKKKGPGLLAKLNPKNWFKSTADDDFLSNRDLAERRAGRGSWVDSDNVNTEDGKVLGAGVYGMARTVDITEDDGEVTTAVGKTDKGGSAAMLDEYVTMKSIPDSDKFVKALGVTEDYAGQTMLLLEHCELGDIKGALNATVHLAPAQRLLVAKYLTRASLSGLKVLHDEGWTHNDFHLANVFMGQDLGAKVGDFGMTSKPNAQEVDERKQKDLAKFVGNLREDVDPSEVSDRGYTDFVVKNLAREDGWSVDAALAHPFLSNFDEAGAKRLLAAALIA